MHRTMIAVLTVALSAPAHAQSRTLMPGDTALILEPTWACVAAVSRRLNAVMPDKMAFSRILRGAEQTGECVEMRKGTRVIIEDVSVMSGTTSLRIEGTETVRLATTGVLDETAKWTGNVFKRR